MRDKKLCHRPHERVRPNNNLGYRIYQLQQQYDNKGNKSNRNVNMNSNSRDVARFVTIVVRRGREFDLVSV
jgi:hypothetical protein